MVTCQSCSHTLFMLPPSFKYSIWILCPPLFINPATCVVYNIPFWLDPPQIEAQHATCEGRGHTKVPRGFPAKTQLLDLRSNHFHYLPANSFPGTSQVVSLHLEFCKIHEIEGGAFRGMTNLFYLYLSDNDLTSLDPGAFAGAPELTYLHLQGNRLAQFPGSGQWLVKSSQVWLYVNYRKSHGTYVC